MKRIALNLLRRQPLSKSSSLRSVERSIRPLDRPNAQTIKVDGTEASSGEPKFWFHYGSYKDGAIEVAKHRRISRMAVGDYSSEKAGGGSIPSLATIFNNFQRCIATEVCKGVVTFHDSHNVGVQRRRIELK